MFKKVLKKTSKRKYNNQFLKIKYSAILPLEEIYDWMQILSFLLVEPLPVNQNPGFLLATNSACQSNIWHVLVKRGRVEKEKMAWERG